MLTRVVLFDLGGVVVELGGVGELGAMLGDAEIYKALLDLVEQDIVEVDA